MSNDQSYQDNNGQLRDVRVVEFDSEGEMSDEQIVLGQAATYAEALEIVKDAGYNVAPESGGYDIGHVANTDGPDAYGIPVLV